MPERLTAAADRLQHAGGRALSVLLDRTRSSGSDRGDVPGWVLVTLMTAGLVVAIWAIAGPALEGVFEDAIDRVSSVGG